jgi:hypothetical protein
MGFFSRRDKDGYDKYGYDKDGYDLDGNGWRLANSCVLCQSLVL